VGVGYCLNPLNLRRKFFAGGLGDSFFLYNDRLYYTYPANADTAKALSRGMSYLKTRQNIGGQGFQ